MDQEERLSAALADRYRVEREIGSGGMATVYLAQDLKHDRQVAVKVLKQELAAVVGTERFLSEIRTTANLQHPNILPLHDSGDADGLLYYVMPFVDGESLRDRLDRERQLPVDEAVRLAVDIAEALDYAHRHGVIHRDIKPANILLTEGRPLIADFGIARAVSSVDSGRLTETGMSLGTPFYMSPEQATGERDATGATDIYSLACVLYEMLVGEPPFTGPNSQAILARLLADRPSSTRTVRRSVPPNVDSAITKALEKIPADRFLAAKDFATALTDPSFRYSDAQVEGISGAARRRMRASPLTLVVLVALAAVAVWGWTRPTPEPPVIRYVVGQSPEEAMVVSYGPSLALSPDGSLLVYPGPDGTGGQALWVKERDAPHARMIPGTGGTEQHQPFFFPDGERVGYISSGAIKVVSVEDGAPTTLADQPGFFHRGVTRGPDGSIYVTGRALALERWSESSGVLEPVTELKDGERAHQFPDALPGGRGVLFTVTGASAFDFSDADIAVVDLETGEHHVIVEGGVIARFVPSSHLVYVGQDGGLYVVPFDERELRVTGESLPLSGNIVVGEVDAPAFGVDLAVSASGTLAYVAGRPAQVDDSRLVWVRRDGSTEEIDPGWRARFEGMALSADESRLAVTLGRETDTDIWIKPLDAGGRSLLTFTDGVNRRPAWTPDDRSVTYVTGRAGDRDLYVKRADGSGSPEVVLDLPVTVDEGFWSRDGEWLILRTGKAGEERDIVAWRAGTPSEDLIPVATDPGIDEVAPALSPDGHFLAYVSDESGRQEVWVRAFPAVEAGRWRVSLEGGTEPVWARNGRELFYKSGGNLVSVAVETDPVFSHGEEEALFSVRGYFQFNVNHAYDVAADGERFVMIRLPDPEAELVVVENFLGEGR